MTKKSLNSITTLLFIVIILIHMKNLMNYSIPSGQMKEEKKQISKNKIIIKITIQLILEVFLPLPSKVHLTMNQQINP